MKRFQIAIAALACSVATGAMASGTYTLTSSAPSATAGGVGTSSGTSFNGSTSNAYCINGASGCAAGGGTDYGNTYTWNGSTSGSGPAMTMSAWGTQSKSTSALIDRAWIGNYGSNGYGVTSQSSGELDSSHQPDASSPLYQHAIDNVNAYESLMFSFASAVTLNSISVGFTGGHADATVLEYTGSGAPPALTGESYADLLTNGWRIVGNLLNIGANSTDALSGGTNSKYWMIGSYLPIGGNSSTPDGNTDAFKLTGFVAINAVPEPDSIALFGIAAVAFAASRRRRAQKI
jgi:PEP-CTERM motif